MEPELKATANPPSASPHLPRTVAVAEELGSVGVKRTNIFFVPFSGVTVPGGGFCVGRRRELSGTLILMAPIYQGISGDGHLLRHGYRGHSNHHPNLMAHAISPIPIATATNPRNSQVNILSYVTGGSCSNTALPFRSR